MSAVSGHRVDLPRCAARRINEPRCLVGRGLGLESEVDTISRPFGERLAARGRREVDGTSAIYIRNEQISTTTQAVSGEGHTAPIGRPPWISLIRNRCGDRMSAVTVGVRDDQIVIAVAIRHVHHTSSGRLAGARDAFANVRAAPWRHLGTVLVTVATHLLAGIGDAHAELARLGGVVANRHTLGVSLAADVRVALRAANQRDRQSDGVPPQSHHLRVSDNARGDRDRAAPVDRVGRRGGLVVAVAHEARDAQWPGRHRHAP